MNTPDEIMKIADVHLVGAISLENSGYYKSAFYLAGYSVELYLKAKICIIWDQPNLFSEGFANKNTPEEDFKEVCRAIKTHRLQVLLSISGLNHKFKQLLTNNSNMHSNASSIIKNWKETERYKLSPPISGAEIKNIINNLEDFLQWIKEN